MAFVAGLRSNLGAAGVLTGPDAAPYLTDQRGAFTGEALAVVRPASADETVTVVRACAAGVAIVPQGGNTGMSGGSVPAVAGRSTDALPAPVVTVTTGTHRPCRSCCRWAA